MKITLKKTTSITCIKAHREHQRAIVNDVREITINAYRLHYSALNRYGLEDEMDIKDVTTSVINQLVLNMQEQGLSSHTISNHMSYLRNLLNYCLDIGYIDKMPKIKSIKITAKQKQPLTASEIEKLLVMPKDMDFPTYRNWIQTQLILATGIRSRNVREVKVSDLDLTTQTLFLSHTKTIDSVTIHLSPSIVKLLTSYVNKLELDDNSPLFPSQWGKVQNRTAFVNSMNKFFTSQGVDRCTPHLLRHTYASQLAKSNVPIPIISKMLCHKNIRTTSRYINMMEEDVREVAKNVDILADFQPKKRSRIKL